jgi:hypothetical protein
VHDFLKSLDNLINNFNKKNNKNVFLRQKSPFLCTYALIRYAGMKKASAERVPAGCGWMFFKNWLLLVKY